MSADTTYPQVTEKYHLQLVRVRFRFHGFPRGTSTTHRHEVVRASETETIAEWFSKEPMRRSCKIKEPMRRSRGKTSQHQYINPVAMTMWENIIIYFSAQLLGSQRELLERNYSKNSAVGRLYSNSLILCTSWTSLDHLSDHPMSMIHHAIMAVRSYDPTMLGRSCCQQSSPRFSYKFCLLISGRRAGSSHNGAHSFGGADCNFYPLLYLRCFFVRVSMSWKICVPYRGKLVHQR